LTAAGHLIICYAFPSAEAGTLLGLRKLNGLARSVLRSVLPKNSYDFVRNTILPSNENCNALRVWCNCASTFFAFTTFLNCCGVGTKKLTDNEQAVVDSVGIKKSRKGMRAYATKNK
jgi:hypothetical protein